MSGIVAGLLSLLGALVGAAILAAGVWLRHRYIRPEPPVCTPCKGNPWVPPTANEGEQA